MKYYRISIDVDIRAKNLKHADLRASQLYSDLGQRAWIVEVLPNGIEERIPIASMRPVVVNGNCSPPGCPSDNNIMERETMADATVAQERHLPPDPDGMNDRRAFWANLSLREFMKATGCEIEDALVDLIADLMHWSDRMEFDFDTALDRARDHYKAETAREEYL